MTPEERRQFETRMKTLEEENGRLKEAVVRIFQDEFKSIFDGLKGSEDVTNSVVVQISGTDSGGDIFSGSDTIDAVRNPDNFILFRYNGKKLKIPLYNA